MSSSLSRGPPKAARSSIIGAACASGAPSGLRLTVGGFTDGGEVTLLTADRQSFCLPSSLLPAELQVGDIVNVAITRSLEEEAARRIAILQLQGEILKSLENPRWLRPSRLVDPLLLLPTTQQQPQQQQDREPLHLQR
ncbi:hypothetical protein ACSSS7_006082 [Eimeria intestinalis]